MNEQTNFAAIAQILAHAEKKGWKVVTKSSVGRSDATHELSRDRNGEVEEICLVINSHQRAMVSEIEIESAGRTRERWILNMNDEQQRQRLIDRLNRL